MNGVKLELMTNTLAKSVYVSLPNGDNEFSDNFFDLIPGKKIVLYMNTKIPAGEVSKQLQVKSLIDFQLETKK